MLGKIIKIIVCYCLFINLSFATDYYVDDASNTGDVWTAGAIGNDANNGTTTSTPKATVNNVLSSYVLGAGDVIYIDAGTYNETAINVSTNDDGSGGTYMIIRGAGKALTIFNAVGTANTFNFSNSGVQYVKVMDLKVSKNSGTYNTVNFSSNTISYIWFENCELTQAGNNEVVYGSNTSTANTNIKFNNCTITNTSTTSDADGIELNDDFDNTTISNSTFSIDGTSKAIFIYNNTTVSDPSGIAIFSNTISVNHATSPSVRAILVQGKTNSNIYSNTVTMSSNSSSSISIAMVENGSARLPYSSNIYSNTVNSSGTCIMAAGFGSANVLTNINIYSNNLTVNSSSATHVGLALQYVGSSGNPINVYKNKIVSGYYGIYLISDVQYCSIYNNYVSNAAYCFYSLGSTHDNTDIYFNSFYGSTNGGYIDELSTTHNIKNNIFNSTSVSSNDYALEIITNATLCASMNYNLYYVPNGARVGYFGSTSYATFANWQAVDKVTGGTLGEENGQTGDPKFVNAASNNLDIHNASSKAYKLGTPAGSITTDIYGTTRHATTPWIGAFENEVTLSVNLLYFNANEYEKEVQLSWSTSSETNNDYFIVERSLDGKTFEEITREKGAGNSIHKNYYFSLDLRPLKGISYYRLKQVDFDGRYTFSQIQSVDMKGLLSIYPNPSKNQFFIFGLSKSNITISLMNSNGIEIDQVNYLNNGCATIDLSSKPEGIYFLKIIDGEYEWLEKLIKVD